MNKFAEWLNTNYPKFLNEEDHTIKPWITSPVWKFPNQPTNAVKNYYLNPDAVKNYLKPDKDYKADEIVIKKQIIPKDFIKAAQTNPEKWDRDFQNLQAPGTMPSKYHTGSQWNDIGFATHKDFMDKPVTMYVVTDESMKRIHPDFGAYASIYGNYIVMPEKAFIELPTATSDGKLTKWGKETLAHELRHTTQKGNTPRERWQNQKLSISTPEGYHHYMHDPIEMGVRLAAIKNLLDEKLIEKIKDVIIVDFNIAKMRLDDYLYEGITTQGGEDIILNTEKWVNTAYNEMKRKLNDGQYYEPRAVAFIKNNIIDPNPEIENSKKQNMIARAKQLKDFYLLKHQITNDLTNEKNILIFILDLDLYLKIKIKNNIIIKEFQQKFVEISNKIKAMIEGINSDADSLIKFYGKLKPQEKKNYLDELLRFYDQVVKTNKPNRNLSL